MSERYRVYEPLAPLTSEAVVVSSRLESLRGTTVGFVDNAKPNFNLLAEDLADLLVKNYGVKAVIQRGKRSPGIPAPKELIAELVADCDLVITGSGD